MDTFVIYKPYMMLSQFSRELPHHISLADLDFDFASDVYPIGRLDADSEGLLILSNLKSLNERILDPKSKKEKTYCVQVEGIPKYQDLEPFKTGLTLKIKSKVYKTRPAKIKILDPIPQFPERNPPIRFRKNQPTSWLEIKLIEGKNRQVRKMCASIGFPVLRLIRTEVAGLVWNMDLLKGMIPGQIVRIENLDRLIL